MNQKDLYRAIGNISDRHIVNVRGRHSDFKTHSVRDSSYERTIVMGVVKQKKIRLRILAVAAAILVAAGVVVAAAYLGTKKVKKEYKEKKIENYFMKDEGFALAEGNIVWPEQVHCDENGIYFTGYMSFSSGKHYPTVSLYSVSKKDIKVIEPDECDAEYYNAVSVSDSDVWIWYTLNNGEGELLRIDTHTLETTGRITVGKDEWIAGVTEKEDGTYFVQKCIMDNYVKDYIFCTYDSNLDLISERSVSDSELINNKGAVFGGNAVSDDGSYYMIYSDADDVYTLYKYSSQDELLYSIMDVTADLEDEYCGIFISDAGNPVVFSCDSQSRIYYFDELDQNDGTVVKQYEMSAELSDEWSYISAYMTNGSYGQYDFTYFSDKKLYGGSSENEKSEVIADLSGMFNDSVSISSSAVSGDLILLAGEYALADESGTYICKTDYSGNVLNRNNLSNISDHSDPKVREIITDGNGEIWTLISDSNNTACSAVKLSPDLTVKKTVALESSDTGDFIADRSGRIAFFDNDSSEIVLADAEGSRLYSRKTSQQSYFFESDGICYAASSSEGGKKTVIYRLDFEKKDIYEVNVIDFEIQNILNGSGKYDACLVLNDGISGYTIKDNSVEELINYIDSDLDFAPQQVSVCDENTLICRYTETEESFGIELAVLKRADNDTLKKIQEHKVLNVAAGYLNENIVAAIKDFNRDNANYRIHIDDYSKYTGTETGMVPGYFRNSGLSALESEFVNGNIPDMILFGSDFDMLRYIGFDAFADINEIMTEDLSDSSRYFENIISAYQYNGKQVTLPLTYRLLCMSGKAENADGKTSFTAEELLETDSRMNTFYLETYETLTELMISSNVTEFIDTKNFTCDFDNEKFRDIIELIKKNAVSQEKYKEAVYLGGDSINYERALADDLCRFKTHSLCDLLSSVISHEQYNHLENPLYTGFPSEKSNGIIIKPELTAAVFASSEKKKGAAEFLNYLLSNDVQYQNCTLYDYEVCYPVNRAAYMRLFEMEKLAGGTQTTDCYGKRITEKYPDEETAERVKSIISSASVTSLSDSKIREIINEQTGLYYSDVQSAEDTAKNIQHKVSLYLREIR